MILQAFGHESMDPSHGYTTENLHQTFLKTLQGDALPSLIETMMENLQGTMLQPSVLKAKPSEWQVDGIFAFCYKIMFEAGYLTLFGKDLDGDKSVARQQAQKALVLNALENFKEFDKIFPALIAGLPIHVFMSAYSARENLAKTLLHENLSKRANVSDLISLRMLLNDTLSSFNELSKARTHVAILWASQANTLPATFWTLFYLIRYHHILHSSHTSALSSCVENRAVLIEVAEIRITSSNTSFFTGVLDQEFYRTCMCRHKYYLIVTDKNKSTVL